MAREPLSEATRILGERLRAYRMAGGLSQEKFAVVAGVHWTFVSQAERGLRNVNLHNLLKFADGLGIDAGVLVQGLHQPGNEPEQEPEPEPVKPGRRRARARN